jgi:hypothetical protein
MAVTTAGDIVRKALGLILQLGQQDTLSSGDLEDGLDGLNTMLDSWWTERLACYALRTDTLVLSGGVNTYTIGPGGDINSTRPVRIENAFVRTPSGLNSVDYPIDIIGQTQWDAIGVKNITGIPRKLFYNPQYPLAEINLYPAPLSNAYTLYIDSYLRIQSFDNAADLINLPPGYARALIYNLALEVAPAYAATPSALVMKFANESKRVLKRLNSPDMIAATDPALVMNRGGQWNINTGAYS